jgi:ADP-heptose:LPS heptosyltransferase
VNTQQQSAFRAARFHVRRALRNLRGDLRVALGYVLKPLLGRGEYASSLDASEVSSVLICRVNARLGNALFLTPLIERIHALMPNAAIDLAIGYPRANDLLGDLPGIRRIVTFPYKGVQIVWRYLGALRAVRRERYDLVIDPTPHSTSGRLVLALCRARYKLGFAVPSQWAPLTHAVPPPDPGTHQAVQPVELLSRALQVDFDPGAVRLWLPLRTAELDAGRVAIARAIGCGEQTERLSRVFSFFAHATGFKALDRAYWTAFWDAFLELEPDAIPVEFLPGPAAAPTDTRFATLHVPSQRALTAAIAATRLFISADAGPMHLASTTPVPTIALFRATEPALYGPLKSCDVVIDARSTSPREAAEICRRAWRQASPAPERTPS